MEFQIYVVPREHVPSFSKGVRQEEAFTKSMPSEVLEEIQAVVDGAEEQMKALGDPIDMFEHAYARMPAYLKEQKEAFAREVAAITEENIG